MHKHYTILPSLNYIERKKNYPILRLSQNFHLYEGELSDTTCSFPEI